MGKHKRFTAWVLSFLMVLCFMPMQSFAADEGNQWITFEDGILRVQDNDEIDYVDWSLDDDEEEGTLYSNGAVDIYAILDDMATDYDYNAEGGKYTLTVKVYGDWDEDKEEYGVLDTKTWTFQYTPVIAEDLMVDLQDDTLSWESFSGAASYKVLVYDVGKTVDSMEINLPAYIDSLIEEGLLYADDEDDNWYIEVAAFDESNKKIAKGGLSYSYHSAAEYTEPEWIDADCEDNGDIFFDAVEDAATYTISYDGHSTVFDAPGTDQVTLNVKDFLFDLYDNGIIAEDDDVKLKIEALSSEGKLVGDGHCYFYFNWLMPEEIEYVNFVDINTYLSEGETVFTGCFGTTDLDEELEIADEVWTNTKTGETVSRSKGGEFVLGDVYAYSLTIKARDGYRLKEGFDFSYDWEDCDGCQFEYTRDKHGFITEATISGILPNKVVKKNIKGAVVTVDDDGLVYNGEEQYPPVTVVKDGKELVEGKDYELDYPINERAGKGRVIIYGKGEYTDEIWESFNIAKRDFKKLSFSLEKSSYTYTGNAIYPKVVIKDGGKVIDLELNMYGFTYTWKNNKNTGTATVIIKSNGEYSNYTDGSVTKTFKITPRKITPTVTLSSSSYTYNGKARKPTVTVKDGKKTIPSSQYTVSYASGRKNVGTYKVTVKMKGNYKGSKTVEKTFRIIPKKTTLKSLSKAKKAITVKWGKQSSKMSTGRITGYQIQLATDKNFKKNVKNVYVTGYKTVSKKVTGLKGGKKYYVRVRTYKTIKVNGKNVKHCSSWSNVKSTTTKK